MVPTEKIDKRESQQQRILGAAYLVGEPLGTRPLGTRPLGTRPLGTRPLGTRNKNVVATHYAIYPNIYIWAS